EISILDEMAKFKMNLGSLISSKVYFLSFSFYVWTGTLEMWILLNQSLKSFKNTLILNYLVS
ncbi:hypothetical protein BVY13_18665, partial [Bacillus amyloliquefaciens]